MKSLLALAAAATVLLISASFPAVSQEQVGQATLVKTSVTGDSGPIVTRSPVHRDERIRTSNSGLGEFRFRDGTKFAEEFEIESIPTMWLVDKKGNLRELNAREGMTEKVEKLLAE